MEKTDIATDWADVVRPVGENIFRVKPAPVGPHPALIERLIQAAAAEYGGPRFERLGFGRCREFAHLLLDGEVAWRYGFVPGTEIKGCSALRLVLYRAGVSQPPLFKGEKRMPSELELRTEASLTRFWQ